MLVGEDCDAGCDSRPVITGSRVAFQTKVKACIEGTCPDNVPIGCWNTSDVTDMAQSFEGLYEQTDFNKDINCWNVASVSNMSLMFFNSFQSTTR